MLKSSRNLWQFKFFVILLALFSLAIISCNRDNGRSADPTTPTAPTDALSAGGAVVSGPVGGSSTPETPSTTPPPAAGTIISESLKDGLTKGSVKDGTFTPEGIQFQGGWWSLRYSIPTTPSGYLEFNAKGFVPNESPGGGEFKAMLVTMWSGDEGYDYDRSRFIFEFRKFGLIPDATQYSNCFHLRIKSNGTWEHGHYPPALDWDPNATYRIRVEWGGGIATVFRDGLPIATCLYHGDFAPPNHIIQIGSNSENPMPFRWKETCHNLLISDVVVGTL
jgi:hypothetical protein